MACVLSVSTSSYAAFRQTDVFKTRYAYAEKKAQEQMLTKFVGMFF